MYLFHSNRNGLKKVASFSLVTFFLLQPFSSFVSAEGSNFEGTDSLIEFSDVNAPKNNFVDVRKFDGALNYSYPVRIPVGRNGLGPDITIKYDSNSASDHDFFGYGWSVEIPQIKRVNNIGVNNLYTGTSTFWSSLSGELVQIGSTNNYRAKIESGNFLDYKFENNVWTANDKSGTQYTFGSTTSSRQDNSASSSQIFRWLVDDVRDTNNNYIKYEYFKNQNQVYPEVITYTGNGSTEGIYEVHFEREAKSTEFANFYPKFKVVTDYRIGRIEIHVDDSWARRYDLGYVTGDNGSRDLLSTITESGRTEDTITTINLPDESFSYQVTNDRTLATYPDSNYSDDIPGYFYDTSETMYDQGYRLVDVNGDGLVDIVRAANENRSNADIYINTGSGWATSTWNFSGLINSGDHLDFRFGAVNFVDVNGDHLVDVVTSYLPDGGTVLDHVYLNTGTGWTVDYTFGNSLPGYFIEVTGSNNYNDQGYAFGDVNGDGLIDLMHDNDTSSGDREVYINDGTKWVEDTSIFLPSVTDMIFDKMTTRPVDVNGDGLVDLVHSAKQSNLIWKNVYINNGGSWSLDQTWSDTIPDYFVDTNESFDFDLGYRYIDINNDNLVDLVHKDDVYFNIGNGWGSSTPWGFPTDSDFDFVHQSAFLLDINGDDIVDLIRSDKWSPYAYQDVFLSTGNKADLFASTTNKYGGEITVSYEGSSASNLNPNLPFAMSVVDEISFDSEFGNTWSKTYSYQDGDYYYDEDDIRDRRFAGFGQVTETNDLNKKITYTHQANSVATTSEEEIDGENLIGKVYRIETTDLSDNLFELNRDNYATTSLGDGSAFVKLESNMTMVYDGDSDHKDSAVSYTYDSSHGSVLTVTEHGEVSGSTDGTYTDIGTDDRTIAYEYATNTSGVVLPSKKIVEDDSSNTVSESRFYYDSLSPGSVGDGNLTKKEDWVVGSAYVDTEWTYDSYGNVLTKTDPRNNVTQFEYETNNLFVSSTTNAVGHNNQYEYDLSSGQVATTTDQNSEVYVTTYDALDRPIEVYSPDPQAGNQVLVKETEYTDTAGAVRVKETNNLSSSLDNETYRYLDGFGRTIQERMEAEGVNEYAVIDYVFNKNGLLEKESLPYFDSGTARSTATTDTDLYSTYTYDALERVTRVATAIGNTDTAYDQWTETVTDASSNNKSYEHDAFGRLVTVTENEGVSSYNTDYGWDDLNNLVKITDAGGNERNITYDGLSRRTQLEDLHDPLDSTFGKWLFEYDNTGNISSTTDPKGQVINFTHDAINRVLTEDYLGDSGTEVTYTYDNCTNGIGSLCQVVNKSATTTNSYTPNGLIAIESKVLGGVTYSTSYEYDRLGNQTLITYPDNSVVKYTYHKGNRVDKVEQRESGDVFTEIIKDIDYGPHGEETHKVFGNDTKTTKTYNEAELYRLSSIVTLATSTLGVGGPGADFSLLSGIFETDLSSTTVGETDPVELSASEEEVVLFQELEINMSDAASTSEIVSTSTQELEISLTASTSIPLDIASSSVIKEIISVRPESDSLNSEIEIPLDKVTAEKENKKKLNERVEFVTSRKADKKNFKEYSDKLELKQGGKKDRDQEITIEAKKEKPEVRIKKWNNEVDFGISYNSLTASLSAKNHGNLVRWESADGLKEVHAYPLPASDEVKGGGFEIEVLLTEKPSSNKFEFEIDGYENLSFYYQPELTAEQIAEGMYQPENVIGSYAVYHKEKAGHILGQTNYATGKAFHIYRPKVSDADDKEIWGQLDYLDGKLIVTVPEEFLNNASYPVVVDPTFGYTTVGASSGIIGRDDFDGVINLVPNDYGAFSSVSIYCDLFSGSSENIKPGIYNMSTTGLITNGVGSPVACTNTAGWKNTTYPSAPTLIPGSSYLVGAFAQGTNARLFYDWQSGNSSRNDKYNNYANPDQYLGSLVKSGSRYSIYVTYAEIVNASPTAPTLLETNDETNPTDLSTTTPNFSAIYNDPNSGDIAAHYQIQVSTSSSFVGTYWDSGSTTLAASTTESNRIDGIVYEGSSLEHSTTYYWRIKFWDDEGAEGIWSTSAAFSLADLSAPQFSELALSLHYTYDSVGNITQITDSSQTLSAATTTYEYDDLYRLTSASTTLASTSPYSRTYTYNSIGNILSKSDQGSYTYAETNNANPHAVTAVGGNTLTYDLNGNLTSDSEGDYTWDYKNQLTQAVTGATTSYEYGYDGSRVVKSSASSTTYYPFSHYEVAGTGTSTKHIYVGDMLVATIEGSGAGSLTYYNHLDHLNSTRVVTDGIGFISSELDFHPFGDSRIDNDYGDFRQHIQHTGHQKDDETSLIYQGARYYNSENGRFTALDPVSLDIGAWKDMNEDVAVSLPDYFRNPQRFNTYAYTGNNPIKNVDKNGKDYYEFSADIALNPVNINAGLKFDPDRMRLDATIGGGPSGGGSANLSVAYNPWGDLPDENSYITQEAYVAGGYILGGKGYIENQPFKDGGFSDINLSAGGTVGAGLGIGLSGGVQANWNTTLFDLSKSLTQLRNGLDRLKKLLGSKKESSQSESKEEED